ncbi:MAG: hypothetical protein KC503_33050 [Myxococcales bacterium]|nr:hypothetical protein [Myxococcales bacterium]
MRTLVTTITLFFATGLLFAASPAHARPKKSRKRDARSQVVLEGTIRVVRSIDGGYPQLTDQRAKRYLLVGTYRAELRRLSGHGVKVWGMFVKKRLMFPTLKVRRYVITNSGGGRKPVVGRLRAVGKRKLRLVHKDGTYVVQAKRPLARRMRQRNGCKVWVAGEVRGKTVHAYKFGWLSCKKQRPIKPPKSAP